MKIRSVLFKDAIRIGGEVFGFATAEKHDIEFVIEKGYFCFTMKKKTEKVYVPVSNVKSWTCEEDTESTGKKSTTK